MRLLHTSDWHVGKLLRGRSRIDEHRAVLGEIADVAARERVDVVVVAGDLFETAAPSPEATAVVFDALLALRDTGAAVVVVGGNHDQQQHLDAVAPVFRQLGITVLGLPDGPERAVADIAGARFVLLPWVSQRWAVKTEQLMGAAASEAVQYYAARVSRLLDWLCAGFVSDAANIVVAHCMVRGGVLGGGERDAQLIDEYAIPAAAFPASAGYVALGHLHRAQRILGAAPIWYSGSPVQVDFGETEDRKQVLIVDVPLRGATTVTPIELQQGWRLRTVRGTLAEIEAYAASADDAWLRVDVREPARPGLADDVRLLLPQAVDVRLAAAAPAPTSAATPVRNNATPREMFTSYLDAEGHAHDDAMLALFDELLDEVDA